jgi:myo-inositol-1(or 4)-monophosphatase
MPIHLLQIAKKLAHDAGKLALEYQANGFKIESKGGTDLVTEADKACEALIIKTIQGNFPDHAILSEESGLIGDPKAEYKWIVDPIDGTVNYAHGLPFYCVSIAIIHKGLPIIGVVDAPALKQVFWAQKGKGAFNDHGKTMRVSKVSDMSKAMIVMGYPYAKSGPATEMSHKLAVDSYTKGQQLRRMGSAALEVAYMAAGAVDVFWHYQLKPWDFAASKIILEEAGGMMTDMNGQLLAPKTGRVLATNGLLHQSMIDLITSHGGDKVM